MNKDSYALGMYVADHLLDLGVTKITFPDFNRAIKTVISSGNPEMSRDEMTETLSKLFASCKEIAREQNIRKNKEWLNSNAFRNGTTTYPNGLQIRTLIEGTGDSPAESSTVVFNYEGRLIDGRVFDSTLSRKSPAEHRVSELFTGLKEGLKMMRCGGTYELAIPAELGFGEKGNNVVPPDSTLIFKVEPIKLK